MAPALALAVLPEVDVKNHDHGPAVSDGKINYTSASAIQTFDGCAEKYRLKYVERIPDTGPSIAQQKGTQLDEEMDHYFATGQNCLGPLASLALERGLLPAPG